MKPGTPITLTIDERIQFVAEREIAAAVEAHHAAKRQRGGDEPVQRRDPGAGELSHVRSEPASATRGGQGQPAKPRHFGAVRTRIGIQGDHAFGGSRDHRPAAGQHDQLRARRRSRCSGAPSTKRTADTGPFPWRWCWRNRATSAPSRSGMRVGQAEHVPVCAEVRFRTEDRHPAAGGIAPER